LGDYQLYPVHDLLRVSEYALAVGIADRVLGQYNMVDFNGF
jgi:hypothetical protein